MIKNDLHLVIISLRLRRTLQNQTSEQANMEKLEFACLFERLQKSLKVEIDSNIAEHIYDLYSHTYDNYGLFELYSFVRKQGTKITPKMMNWNTLLEVAKQLKLPQKHMNESIIMPLWYLMRDRYDDSMSITFTFPKFEIIKGDVFLMQDGFTYQVNEIYLMNEELYTGDDEEAICNDCMVCLENLDTGDFQDIKAWDFLYALNGEDVQFIESNWLEFVNK